MSMIKFKKVKTESDFMKALAIRFQVFCEEQKINRRNEFDIKDQDAVHYLIYIGETPIGTCRYLKEKNYYLIGRVAVLSDYRNNGYGSFLIKSVIQDILNIETNAIIELHAQIAKKDFYEKLGFVCFGHSFLEADIEHIGMRYLNK